jgi:hypothetical protein
MAESSAFARGFTRAVADVHIATDRDLLNG